MEEKEEFKLSTGKKINLQPVTWKQREVAENAIIFETLPGNDGEPLMVRTLNATKERNLWCQFGLGLDDPSGLDEYSTRELEEIAWIVKGQALAAKNPTKEQS